MLMERISEKVGFNSCNLIVVQEKKKKANEGSLWNDEDSLIYFEEFVIEKIISDCNVKNGSQIWVGCVSQEFGKNKIPLKKEIDEKRDLLEKLEDEDKELHEERLKKLQEIKNREIILQIPTFEAKYVVNASEMKYIGDIKEYISKNFKKEDVVIFRGFLKLNDDSELNDGGEYFVYLLDKMKGDKMKIGIKTNKAIEDVEVPRDLYVSTLKYILSTNFPRKVPPYMLELFKDGKRLENNRTLIGYGIEEGSLLSVSMNKESPKSMRLEITSFLDSYKDLKTFTTTQFHAEQNLHSPVYDCGFRKETPEGVIIDENHAFKKENPAKFCIHEPSEFFCPSSNELVFYDKSKDKWSEIGKFKNIKYGENNITSECDIQHFTPISLRNFREWTSIVLQESTFHPKYDFDYSTINDEGKEHKRGPLVYTRPCGWISFAIRVLEKYENDDWIKIDESNSTWPAAYHGTPTNLALKILQEGVLKPGKRQQGSGTKRSIFMGPSPTYVEENNYCAPVVVPVLEERYKVMFLARVKLGAWKEQTEKSPYKNQNEWIFDNAHDIRLYKILIKKG